MSLNVANPSLSPIFSHNYNIYIFINFIGGIDDINIQGENNPQLRGAENVAYSSWQTTLGLTYKNLFSKKGYFQSSFGKSLVALKAKVYELDQNLNRNYYFNRDFRT